MKASLRVKKWISVAAATGIILILAILGKQILLPLPLPQHHEIADPLALPSLSPTFESRMSSVRDTTVAGVTVQVDRTTGRLLPPTDQQKQALATAFRQQFSQPSPHATFSHSNGMLSVVVGQSQLNFSLAQVNPEGALEVSCQTGVDETATRLEYSIPQPSTTHLPEEE